MRKCLLLSNKPSRSTTLDSLHVLLNCRICTDREIAFMLQLSVCLP